MGTRTDPVGSPLLDWDGAGAASYTLESSNNGDNWNPLCEVGSGDGGKDYLPVPPTESRYIRISTKSAAGLSLFAVEVLGSKPAQRPQRRRN